MKNITFDRSTGTKRKPHNHLAGYVCERKSAHAKLPGYFAIFDKKTGGDWVTGTDGHRYGVLHIYPDEHAGCVITFTNLPSARAVMVEMATGGNIGDFGQHDLA